MSASRSPTLFVLSQHSADPGVGGHVNVLGSAYVRCCYAAEISALVATLDVATLQRSLFSLLRNMGWGGGVG